MLGGKKSDEAAAADANLKDANAKDKKALLKHAAVKWCETVRIKGEHKGLWDQSGGAAKKAAIEGRVYHESYKGKWTSYTTKDGLISDSIGYLHEDDQGDQGYLWMGSNAGLMRAPKLLLVDEPSLGLSPLLVKENFSIIRRVNERGITVFLVEQNVHQTLAISHYGYVLAKGRVVAAGTPAELADRPEVREAYFG